MNYGNILINEKEVFDTWSGMITEATGIESKSKLQWMSKYCHFHNLNESVYNTAHVNPNANINGMGAITFPGDPTGIQGFSGQAAGSGDKPFSLLPLAMQVAAQTVGLDLVPVIPMQGPLGILTYLDFVYAGGRLNSGAASIMVKAPVFSDSDDATALVVNTAYYAGTAAGGRSPFQLTFVGLSRIDGYPIFRVKVDTGATYTQGQEYAGASVTPTLATAITANASLWSDVAGTTSVADFDGNAELVKALEDHVTGFSGSGFANDSVASDQPYEREAGEDTVDNLLGLKLFNKSISAKTYQAAAAVTREQVQDLKQFGIDAIAQVEAVLINELTQDINKLILGRIFSLGATNAEQIFNRDGVSLSLVLSNATGGTTTVALGNGEDGTPVSIPTADTNVTQLGGETQGSVQRRILSKVLAASNMIAIRGRRGAATFAVTNGQLCTALQDIAGFVAYPLSNTVNQSGGSLYPVGNVAGVTIYNDPNMQWDDTRMAIGRKGDGNSPGLVFMPYLMAESVETIAEGTMAPKIAVKSRFALVDAGQHPQTMYYTMKVVANTALTGVSLI